MCIRDRGSRPRGRPKRTWKEVVREDCQARKLNKEDAVDRCKMEKGDNGSTLTRMGVSGCMFLLVPGCPGQTAVKWLLLLLFMLHIFQAHNE